MSSLFERVQMTKRSLAKLGWEPDTRFVTLIERADEPPETEPVPYHGSVYLLDGEKTADLDPPLPATHTARSGFVRARRPMLGAWTLAAVLAGVLALVAIRFVGKLLEGGAL